MVEIIVSRLHSNKNKSSEAKNDSKLFDVHFPPRTNTNGKTLFGVSSVYQRQRWLDYASQKTQEQQGGAGC